LPISISSTQSHQFAQKFIDGYCANGFGAMPKREVDLMVLDLLIKCGVVDDTLDAQRISRQLKLPVSKVKALLYELQLRDEDKNEAWLKNELSLRLQHCKFVVTEKDSATRIAIGVDNQLLRTEIEAILKRDGHFPDYSFNREILRLTPEAYIKIIEFLLTESERKHLHEKLKSAIKKTPKDHNEESLWKMALATFVHNTAKAAGEGLGDLSVEMLKAGFTILMNQIFKS